MLKLQMLTNWMGVLFTEAPSLEVPGDLYNDVIPSGLKSYVPRDRF